jgi:hypothetical protein
MEFIWDKPTIIFYRERKDEHERNAFLVVKARKLVVLVEKDQEKIKGSIVDFFPLMGDIDYLTSDKGVSDSYIVCWFDDKEKNLDKSWRKLVGMKLDKKASFLQDKRNKKTYNLNFKAKNASL